MALEAAEVLSHQEVAAEDLLAIEAIWDMDHMVGEAVAVEVGEAVDLEAAMGPSTEKAVEVCHTLIAHFRLMPINSGN